MSFDNWRDDRVGAARDILGMTHESPAPEHGWEPGDFVVALMRAMMRADQTNLFLLSMGFPAHGWAVKVYKDEPGGLPKLRRTAGWALPGDEEPEDDDDD